MASMVVHLACREGRDASGRRSSRALHFLKALRPNVGESISLMLTTITSLPAGWFPTNGKHGCSTIVSVNWRQLWRITSSFCTSVRAGHVAIGDPTIPAWSPKLMYGGTYTQPCVAKHTDLIIDNSLGQHMHYTSPPLHLLLSLWTLSSCLWPTSSLKHQCLDMDGMQL